MRKLSIICSLVLTIALTLPIVGCGPPSGAGHERSTGSVAVAAGRFDPLELSGDREVIPEKYPQTGAISGQVVFETVDSLGTDSLAGLVVELPEEIDSLYGQAYRIQLLTTKVYGESRYALKVAEEIFDRPVSVDYEVPYFKVRVGKFADRDKADEYALRAKAAGYRNAWVVMVNINPKQTAPMYDDELPFFEVDDSISYDEDIEPDDAASDN